MLQCGPVPPLIAKSRPTDNRRVVVQCVDPNATIALVLAIRRLFPMQTNLSFVPRAKDFMAVNFRKVVSSHGRVLFAIYVHVGSTKSCRVHVTQPSRDEGAVRRERWHSDRIKPVTANSLLSHHHVESRAIPDVAEYPADVPVILKCENWLNVSDRRSLTS